MEKYLEGNSRVLEATHLRPLIGEIPLELTLPVRRHRCRLVSRLSIQLRLFFSLLASQNLHSYTCSPLMLGWLHLIGLQVA